MGETIDFNRLAGPIENDYVREWKASGRPVVGFFCAHTPEELLWAAGVLPLRLRGTGSEDTSYADQYLGPFNCRFVRHTLNRLMKGDLAFLDGLLVTNSCDHIRRLFDIFAAKEVAPFNHYLDVPHLNSEESFARLVAQLRDLQAKLESFFGVSISREALSEAIQLHNRTRALLGRASALRAEDPPRSTGSEVLALSVASASMPKDRFNPLAEQRLAELERRDPLPPAPARACWCSAEPSMSPATSSRSSRWAPPSWPISSAGDPRALPTWRTRRSIRSTRSPGGFSTTCRVRGCWTSIRSDSQIYSRR